MAANMIGEQKRIVIVSMGFIDLVMPNFKLKLASFNISIGDL